MWILPNYPWERTDGYKPWEEFHKYRRYPRPRQPWEYPYPIVDPDKIREIEDELERATKERNRLEHLRGLIRKLEKIEDEKKSKIKEIMDVIKRLAPETTERSDGDITGIDRRLHRLPPSPS